MPPTLQEVREQVRQLPGADKAILVDELLTQLAEPDPRIHQLWLEEVRRRVDADSDDSEPSISHEELMAELRRS